MFNDGKAEVFLDGWMKVIPQQPVDIGQYRWSGYSFDPVIYITGRYPANMFTDRVGTEWEANCLTGYRAGMESVYADIYLLPRTYVVEHYSFGLDAY